MKFKIAKGGAIIMQLPLFADEDDEHPAPEDTPNIDPADRAVSREHLFTSFLTAYRQGDNVAELKISVAGGKWLRPNELNIISPDKHMPIGWLSVRNHAREQYQQEIQARNKELEECRQTPHPDDLSAPASTVAAAVAHDAMMDAMRDNIDPLMVEVKTDGGPYLRLIQCTIRTIATDQTMSIYELLKHARQDWQDEKRAEREAVLAETQLTDDWTM